MVAILALHAPFARASEFPHSTKVPPAADQGTVSEGGAFQATANPQDDIEFIDPEKKFQEVRQTMERLDDGKIRIGQVLIDPNHRSILFPARMNMNHGEIEYALVTEKGKAHEALLRTACSPWHIHIAALLVGLASDDQKTKPPLSAEIFVEWETNGPKRRHRLEELIALAKDSPYGPIGGQLEKGPWAYQGSTIDSRGFAAAREGNLITLIKDPSALAMNPRPTQADDGLHVPNIKLLPPLGHPVTLRIEPLVDPAVHKKSQPTSPTSTPNSKKP